MNDTPESALLAYMRAFETLNPEAVLPFYNLPSIFIAPQGIFSIPDANTARALLSQTMEQVRSQAYRRTELLGLTVRRLSSALAQCAGVFVRFNTSDDEITRFGFTYTMHNNSSGWKIVVAVVHDA